MRDRAICMKIAEEWKIRFYKLWRLGRLCRNYKVLAKCCKMLLPVFYQRDVSFGTNIDEDVNFCYGAFGFVINPNVRIRSGTVIQHSVTIGEKNGCHKAPEIGKMFLLVREPWFWVILW